MSFAKPIVVSALTENLLLPLGLGGDTPPTRTPKTSEPGKHPRWRAGRPLRLASQGSG